MGHAGDERSTHAADDEIGWTLDALSVLGPDDVCDAGKRADNEMCGALSDRRAGCLLQECELCVGNKNIVIMREIGKNSCRSHALSVFTFRPVNRPRRELTTN